jgi:hypothetical protein
MIFFSFVFLGNKSSPPPRGVSWMALTGLCRINNNGYNGMILSWEILMSLISSQKSMQQDKYAVLVIEWEIKKVHLHMVFPG